MDRALREMRGDQPPLDDLPALQQRNRKIQRLNGAFTMLRSYQMRRRPAPPRTQAGASGGPGKPGGAKAGAKKRPPQA